MPAKPNYQQLEFIPEQINPAQQRQVEGREGWEDTATEPIKKPLEGQMVSGLIAFHLLQNLSIA